MLDFKNDFPYIVGCILLVIACLVGILSVVFLVQAIFFPDNILFVQSFKSFLSADYPLLFSEIKGKSSKIDVDPNGRMVILLFVVGVLVVGFSALMNGLIRSGMFLIGINKK